ncbi:MAG: ferredoxin [Nocardioidaceae bacterium]|nr:MAG: ferredoxin [Nocardioidaceae bacterium]
MAPKLVIEEFIRCTGHGRCYSEAPDLLDYDDEGFVSVRHAPMEFTEADREDAKAAVRACPERALSIVEED